MSTTYAAWKLSLGFAMILLASVGIKYLFLRADVAIDQPAVAASLAALSERRGMLIRLQPMFGGVTMLATREGCAMGVRVVPPSGELDQSIAEGFASYPRVRYFYAGTLSATRPRLWPLVTYQSSRALNRLGIAQSWTPLLAVADNRRCADDLADFASIRAPLNQEVASRAPR